jgi:hypothetical protein
MISLAIAIWTLSKGNHIFGPAPSFHSAFGVFYPANSAGAGIDSAALGLVAVVVHGWFSGFTEDWVESRSRQIG